jgi:hypothetical protein
MWDPTEDAEDARDLHESASSDWFDRRLRSDPLRLKLPFIP